MKILLTGASGQLGREMAPLLEQMGSVTGVDRDVPPGNTQMLQMDLGDFEAVDALLAKERPDVIVNAAAFTAVDPAEDHPDTAFRLNAGLPERLARWAAESGGFLFHFSTDYVFPGESDRPYREDDSVGPLNVYGESKLAGEAAVAESGCRHLVVRTSWVYSSHGNNFVLTMLRLADERPSLGIVDDQVGCPTWARNLAAAGGRMLERALREPGREKFHGLYHYRDGDTVSWYGFACEIFGIAREMGLLEAAPAVNAVTSGQFPQKAQRPGYSVLDVSRVRSDFGIEPAGLGESLRGCLAEVLNDRN